jgi:hypothetical protein
VLCLLAVTAGHYAAAALHRDGAVAAVPGAGSMRVAVAVLNRPEETAPLLEAGTRLLEIGGGGRLIALTIRMPPPIAVLPSEEVLTAEREAACHAEQEDWIGQLRSVVGRWAVQARQRGVQTDWIEAEGDAAEIVTDHGRRADALVFARPGRHEGERMHACLHAALFATSSPVLVVPPGFEGPTGNVIAIAWKDDDRAPKAVRASLPLLCQAREVHVLCADARASVPPILAEHGIEAEAHRVPDGPDATGDRILRTAHQLGADLLVMGAFAHGEWRERMFGGVTRTMLADSDLPVLMRH